MRRKPGTLLPVEVAILVAALGEGGDSEFYGYAIARQVQANASAKMLTSHGTLYKALDRMVKAGLLSARWEDPAISAAEERPRRRLYQLTAAGEHAAKEAERSAISGSPSLKEGLQPS
ncbi:MAG: PadR family transcriptional regulator [Dehalococcoidia bacterium]